MNFSAAFLILLSSTVAYAGDNTTAPTHGDGVALVELFTSEGCSSCPPADALLGQLVQRATEQHTPIFALAFHVNYWDSLGWRDRFASDAFTARQHTYVEKLKIDSLYTPQMIVNGKTEFIGSDQKAADRSIADALSASRVGVLTVDKKRSTLLVHAADFPVDSILNIAVVEDNLQSEVRRGENGGRTLHHSHVVRWFDTRALRNGNVSVVLPPLNEVKPENASVIVFAQRQEDWRILNAVMIPLQPPTKK